MLINAKEALERFENDKDIYIALIDAFLEMPTPDFDHMKAVLLNGDALSVTLAMHKLKGGALTLGAEDLASIASEAETLLRAGNIAEALPFVGKAAEAYPKTRDTLRAIKDEIQTLL
jgi:HPt (histidine-containing phosphotransfer) domain-containing protein